MKRGINKMQLLVMNTIFQGGLKEEIRSKVLEKGPTLIQESVKLAREFEIISKDKGKSEKGQYMASVSPNDNPMPGMARRLLGILKLESPLFGNLLGVPLTQPHRLRLLRRRRTRASCPMAILFYTKRHS
jgi:hypothetical protein